MANDNFYGYLNKKPELALPNGNIDMAFEKVNPYEFRKGMDYELTKMGCRNLHSSTPEQREKATTIVLKNLNEMGGYYSGLISYETEYRGRDKKPSFKKYMEGMADHGMKEVKDEFKNDKMEQIKLKEAINKMVKEELNENKTQNPNKMTKKELDKMIMEELEAYLREEEEIEVDVEDDAEGGESEDVLRKIYDMLKDMFEGGEEMEDEGEEEEAEEVEESIQSQKIDPKTDIEWDDIDPNVEDRPDYQEGLISGKSKDGREWQAHGSYSDMNPGSGFRFLGDLEEVPSSINELKSRFQKLANIIKG
jgi:hypothetical protein